MATPGRLQRHRDEGNIFLSQVLALVIDEADALLSPEYGDEALQLFRSLRARDDSPQRTARRGPNAERCQYVFASATSNRSLNRMLQQQLPGSVVVKERSRESQELQSALHNPAERISSSGVGQRQIRDTARLSGGFSEGAAIVFCRSVASCELPNTSWRRGASPPAGTT